MFENMFKPKPVPATIIPIIAKRAGDKAERFYGVASNGEVIVTFNKLTDAQDALEILEDICKT